MESERKIVKAEVLFSRQCPLSCSYCAMKSDKQNTRSVSDWMMAMDELHKLGCSFAAFYGAEPLTEISKLKWVIHYCENILGMDTTIITSGAVPDFTEKLLELHRYGARSLSMSFDPSPTDKSTKKKSDNALLHLEKFRNLPNVRDAAAIATLNAENFRLFPDMVQRMTRRGIWSFFDFIHTDRGQVGTKCSVTPDQLMIKPEHYKDLKNMLVSLLGMKERGYLCHTTPDIVETYFRLMDSGNLYNWSCAAQEPSWVTIDCDGMVYPCDDFSGVHAPVDMLDIYDKWVLFAEATTLAVQCADCRCGWGTHIGAHSILAGKSSIGTYIHGKRHNSVPV